MSLIKKRDVPAHFEARRRTRAHPFTFASQLNPAGTSKDGPTARVETQAEFVKDFVGDHTESKLLTITTWPTVSSEVPPEEPAVNVPA